MLECFNDCHWKTVSVDYCFNVCVSMCENAYTTFSTIFLINYTQSKNNKNII